MVLRDYYFTSQISRSTSARKSVTAFLTTHACLCAVGCRGSQADNIGKESVCNNRELSVTDQNLNDIKDSVQKLFQWEAYWTYNDLDSNAWYLKNIGPSISISIFSLRRGVIVFVPGFDSSVVKFRKDIEGTLSNPVFIRSRATFEQDTLKAIAKVLGNWEEFLFFAGIETSKGSYRIPILVSDGEMTRYLDKNRDKINYCETQSEINLLPPGPITYEPMDEKKQALLEEIVKESARVAKSMFTESRKVTITVPNFNYNDSQIWVLLEVPNRESYTVSMNLDVTNPKTSVSYMTTVEIKGSPKYRTPIAADEKIRKAAIKCIELRALNN